MSGQMRSRRRGSRLLLAALVLGGAGFVAARAHAKAPPFTALVAELRAPASVVQGGVLSLEARVDVAAYCAQHADFWGPDCVSLASSSLQSPQLVLSLKDLASAQGLDSRATELVLAMSLGADGWYRGSVALLRCQAPGEYGLRDSVTSGLSYRRALDVLADPACAADQAPPSPVALEAPKRCRSGERYEIVLSVADDFAGPVFASVELSEPAPPFESGYGGGELACAACGRGWRCAGKLWCAEAETTMGIRLLSLVDGAGRMRAGLGASALATVSSGAWATDALPATACVQPVQATVPEPAPAPAGASAPPEPAERGGCAVAGGEPEGSWGGLLLAAAGLGFARAARRRARG